MWGIWIPCVMESNRWKHIGDAGQSLVSPFKNTQTILVCCLQEASADQELLICLKLKRAAESRYRSVRREMISSAEVALAEMLCVIDIISITHSISVKACCVMVYFCLVSLHHGGEHTGLYLPFFFSLFLSLFINHWLTWESFFLLLSESHQRKKILTEFLLWVWHGFKHVLQRAAQQ